jgi:hypothetical protein
VLISCPNEVVDEFVIAQLGNDVAFLYDVNCHKASLNAETLIWHVFDGINTNIVIDISKIEACTGLLKIFQSKDI